MTAIREIPDFPDPDIHDDECPCCLTHSCEAFRRYVERELASYRERLELLRSRLADASRDAQEAKDEATVYRHKLCHLAKEAAFALKLVTNGRSASDLGEMQSGGGRLPQEGEE